MKATFNRKFNKFLTVLKLTDNQETIDQIKKLANKNSYDTNELSNSISQIINPAVCEYLAALCN